MRPTEREHTPLRSPRARGRARSASPASVPQRPSPAEPRDRNRSTHSNSADTKGDFSDVVRDRNVPAVDSSASRWGPSSKAHNETSGRETRHIQHTPTGVTGVESATEDGSMLLRSHSSRGRNRERESASGVADGRQNLNQGQSLPASSTLSASNHLPLHLSYIARQLALRLYKARLFPGFSQWAWLRHCALPLPPCIRVTGLHISPRFNGACLGVYTLVSSFSFSLSLTCRLSSPISFDTSSLLPQGIIHHHHFCTTTANGYLHGVSSVGRMSQSSPVFFLLKSNRLHVTRLLPLVPDGISLLDSTSLCRIQHYPPLQQLIMDQEARPNGHSYIIANVMSVIQTQMLMHGRLNAMS